MILSFDLDGVICDTDNAILGLLYNARTAGWAGVQADIDQYYARQRVLLNPQDFLGTGDSFHIVTGRVPTAQGITALWVQRWLGWGQSSNERLHFVSDDEVEGLLIEGQDQEAYELLAQRKLATIVAIQADVHFDNNPTIVRRLRQAGVKAIQMGGGLR